MTAQAPSDFPGKRVVLTRPADRQQHLLDQLKQVNCEVLALPALTICPIVPRQCALHKHQPQDFDALVFVSRSAWQYYQQFYLRASSWSSAGAAPLLASVGRTTAEQVAHDLGISPDSILCPGPKQASDSESLWSVLEPTLKPGARVLIVRGQTGRDWLADTITEHNMSVVLLSVYRREPARWTPEQINALTRWARTAECANTGTWLITSAQGLAAIEAQFQHHALTGKPGFEPARVVVVHERLVRPVRRWLSHWAQAQGAPSDAAQKGCTRSSTPVVVAAPRDEAMLAGILGPRA